MMLQHRYPRLNADALSATRDALHAYAQVLGAWAKHCRKKRKHWWHASLRPTLYGLSTGVIYGDDDFELALDLVNSQLRVRSRSKNESVPLHGQSSKELAAAIRDLLVFDAGIDKSVVPDDDKATNTTYDYSPQVAKRLHHAFASVAAAMEVFRAGIREETSPIQVWPHHFDLSMLWLPGGKIDGEDPEDEESSDKQMNFGFVFGDQSIPDPYFYVTAYPLPDALPETTLPKDAKWQSEGFNGAVALYSKVAATDDPHAYLLHLWQALLQAGRKSI